MKEVLPLLTDLQELDSKLHEIKNMRGDLPYQVKLLNEELDQAEDNVKAAKNALDENIKSKGLQELEIESLNQKLEKYKAQLYEVKTNKEYDAVTFEIEAVNQKIGLFETEMLDLMENEKTLKEDVENRQAALEQIQEEFKSKNKQLHEAIAKTEVDENKLQKERDAIASKLQPRILSMYERIKNAKAGLAVAPVKSGTCGGCFNNLPPQRMIELRQANRLILCEVCGRILIWEEEKQADQ